MASRNLKPSAGEKVTEEKVQPSHSSTVSAGKPALPAKPSARVTFSTSNNTATRTPDSTNTATTATSVIITSTQNTRPSFSASSVKTSEKPTATVSALTSVNTPATNTVSAIASKESGSVLKGVSSSVTETSTTVCSSSHNGRGKIVTNSQSDTSKKSEPSSPVKLTSPVKPPVFTRPPTLGISGINRSPTRDGSNKLVRKDSDKTGAKISFSDKVQRIPPKELTSPSTPVSSPPSNEDEKVINGLDTVKIDLATQKQAARSAFFSSMSPTSPDVKSPNRDSATLDPGPVVRPGPIVTPVIAGATTKTNAGQTINLVLSGTVSPQSPSKPGAFAIYPPKELVCPPAPSKSPLSSPSKSSSIPVSDKLSSSAPLSPSSLDSEENSSDVVLRNKKVPPPPPPRKTSRPTSASLSPPLNGRASVSEESSPRFVGGVLGHHRLSGGPLSSTPKPTSQNSLGKLDKDITSGLNSKNQKNSIQPVTSDSSKSTTDVKVSGVPCGDAQKCAHTLTSDYLPPPPPHVTMALDRDERGSSSESTSSSSGQSMGSQQSVINVVASKLANDSPSSGPKSPNSSGGAAKPPNTSTFSSSKSSKPDPPRRHSSLLAKFTGSSRDAKTNGSNGKANVNGVDL